MGGCRWEYLRGIDWADPVLVRRALVMFEQLLAVVRPDDFYAASDVLAGHISSSRGAAPWSSSAQSPGLVCGAPGRRSCGFRKPHVCSGSNSGQAPFQMTAVRPLPCPHQGFLDRFLLRHTSYGTARANRATLIQPSQRSSEPGLAATNMAAITQIAAARTTRAISGFVIWSLNLLSAILLTIRRVVGYANPGHNHPTTEGPRITAKYTGSNRYRTYNIPLGADAL